MVKTLHAAFNHAIIINGESLEIACSIGVSIYPDDGTTTDALLSMADIAMYKSKQQHHDKK